MNYPLGANLKKTIWLEQDFNLEFVHPGLPTNQMFFGQVFRRAHRQPSLRERYTTLTPAKVWIPWAGIWSNIQFEGDESLDREEIDAYEIGWRSRPDENLLIELSSYYYDTKNAVLASQTSVNAYEAKDAKSYGGELSIDWDVSHVESKGGYSLARGEIEGERSYDFPERTANLTSRFAYSDDLTFVQGLYYSDETQIPSDYNPITIPAHLRLDLGIVWEPKRDGWEIGLFGRDLLEPYHIETMYPGIDVEPARVERTFTFYIQEILMHFLNSRFKKLTKASWQLVLFLVVCSSFAIFELNAQSKVSDEDRRNARLQATYII